VSFLLDDRTARSMIAQWRDNVARLSVRLSLTLCIVTKGHILQQKCMNMLIWRLH